MIVRSRLLLPVAAFALAFAFALPAAFADDVSKDSMSKDSGMKKDSMSKAQMSKDSMSKDKMKDNMYRSNRVPAVMRRAAFRDPVHRGWPRASICGLSDDHRKPAPDCQSS